MTPGAGIFRTQLPIGFTAGGVNCGVRRYRPDLGVIISESPCVATAVYTQNTCKAAPIKYCDALLPAENIHAIITNSGEANAATGEQGTLNNLKMATALAENLHISADSVLTASTGVIGEQLSIDKITQAIPKLVASVSDIAEKFATAILTTDLVPKTIKKEITLSTGTVTLTGICKGSGMIHPNMATMLGYLLTDAKLSTEQATELLKKSCDNSFNMISVDGETSTNDCVFMLANGMSKIAIENDEDLEIFQQALDDVSIELAKSIARDGEGASKLIQVDVNGLPDMRIAKDLARSVTTSPLIKTAIYGESPNWGRIISRVGSINIPEEILSKCAITIQGTQIFSNHKPKENTDSLSSKLRSDTIFISLDFESGSHSATAWGCDLTENYVKLNADYLS